MSEETTQYGTHDRRSSRPPWRVLVVDDDPAFRAMLAALLTHAGRVEVVADAADGAMAVQQADLHHPDLVLLDLSMPIMGGLEAIPAVRHFSPASRVVILSGVDAEGIGRIALQSGADAFLPKGRIDAATLERTLDEVMAAQPAPPPPWSGALVDLVGEAVRTAGRASRPPGAGGSGRPGR